MKLPWVSGDFRHVLHPPGQRDDPAKRQWYINDHCFFVADDGAIHWYGITNPYPEDIKSYYGPGSHRHVGHASAPEPFGPWTEHGHAFALPEGTQDCIGACFVVRQGREYLMYYGYNAGLTTARSTDLFHWEPLGLPKIEAGASTRDPCALILDDGRHLLYTAGGLDGLSAVCLSESDDLLHWQPQEPALLTNIRCPFGALESPFVLRHDGCYYLFVNYSHRQYEETLVFASDNPRRFDWQRPLCTLFAHAAEFFLWGGKHYISHCGIEDRRYSETVGPSGLRLAELRWADI